jgi:hypothetical protein
MGGRKLMTIKALLDCMIYDHLRDDPVGQDRVRTLIDAKKLIVVVNRTVAEELFRSPFRGIPDFFPYEYSGNTVGRCGLMCAGDSIGAGQVFDKHLGESNSVNDALIADAASWKADWLVSEDKRMRDRFIGNEFYCIPLAYSGFQSKLKEM